MVRRLLIVGFLLYVPKLMAAGDIDAVQLMQQMEDDPVTIRKTLKIDWTLPVETPGQVQTMAPWVISQVLGGYEAAVGHRCAELGKGMDFAHAQGLYQTWSMLRIFLASYQLCSVDAEQTYKDVKALSTKFNWPDIAAFAGAELGFFIAEGGKDLGFRMLEEANQIGREKALNPGIAAIVRGYSAAILGLQNQHEKAVALEKELLASPVLQKNRYQKSALYFNLGMELMNNGGPDGTAKAKPYFKMGQAIAKELGDDYTRALAEVALSSIAFREKKWDEAFSLGQSAFLVFDAVQNARWQGIALFRTTQALIAQRRFTEARQYLDRAKLLFDPADKRAQIRLAEFYSQIHEGMGNLAEALAAQKRYFAAYSDFREQMAEEERAKQVASLELDVSEARNRELQKTNELQAERLQSAQRLKQALGALAAGLVLISALLVFSMIQTKKASDRKKKIRRILDHIDEGIVTIDAHGKVEAEYSHYLQVFLGEQRELTGLDALDVLLGPTQMADEAKSMLREILKVTLGEPALAWELNEGTLPREVIYQGDPLRYAAMHWVPIFDRHRILQSVLLGIRDISAQRLLEAEVAQTKARSMDLQKELAEIIDAGVKPVVPLIQRARQCLGRLDARDGLAELHTIKGIARGLNLQILSQSTHDLETHLKNRDEGFAAALQHYQEVLGGYEELLKMFHLDRVPVKLERLQVLADAMQKVLPGLLELLHRAGLKLGALTIDDQVGEWDEAVLEAMPDILLHAFTNAADHGYILQRVPRDPSFALSAKPSVDGMIEVRLIDQGAGLNRDRVEKLVRERQFVPGADQDIWDVLLLDQATTTETITQTSGRGVGLSAIQARLQPLDGRLRLRPGQLGRGTELCLEIPMKGPGGGICRASQ